MPSVARILMTTVIVMLLIAALSSALAGQLMFAAMVAGIAITNGALWVWVDRRLSA